MSNNNIITFLKLVREVNKNVRKEWNFSASGPQVHLLRCLAEKGPLKMSEVAEAIGVSSSGASNLAKKMMKDGYITRQHIEEDLRIVTISITTEGKEFLQAFSKLTNVVVERYFGKLTADELDELIRLCRKMLD